MHIKTEHPLHHLGQMYNSILICSCWNLIEPSQASLKPPLSADLIPHSGPHPSPVTSSFALLRKLTLCYWIDHMSYYYLLLYFWLCKAPLVVFIGITVSFSHLVLKLLKLCSYVSNFIFYFYIFFLLMFSLLKLMRKSLNPDYVTYYISSCSYTRFKHNFEKHDFYVFV